MKKNSKYISLSQEVCIFISNFYFAMQFEDTLPDAKQIEKKLDREIKKQQGCLQKYLKLQQKLRRTYLPMTAKEGKKLVQDLVQAKGALHGKDSNGQNTYKSKCVAKWRNTGRSLLCNSECRIINKRAHVLAYKANHHCI